MVGVKRGVVYTVVGVNSGFVSTALTAVRVKRGLASTVVGVKRPRRGLNGGWCKTWFGVNSGWCKTWFQIYIRRAAPANPDLSSSSGCAARMQI